VISTILLVDDQRDNLIILEKVIKQLACRRGVSTVSFTNAREALAWCHQHEPVLCLIDYKMPKMDGLEFITAVRKLPGFQTIPIVMITGVTERSARDYALACGATDYWTKPFDPQEVRQRLHAFLDYENPDRLTQDAGAGSVASVV
jgi:two-component system, response regulator RpfG